jgi:hypothetical protein
MSRTLPLVLALAAGTSATAQPVRKDPSPAAGETAAFVVQLGTDTIAVERFTRTGNRVEGDVFNRGPTPRVTHYVVTLDDAGRPQRVEFATRAPDGTPLPNTALSAAITFRADSALWELKRADTTLTGGAAAPAGTVPSIANSYAMYELAMRAIRAAGQREGAISLFAPGAQRPSALKVSLTSAEAGQYDYFGDPVMVTFDRQGRVTSIDGTRSTTKVIVRRQPTADVRAIATAYAARPAMGQTSPRDTVRATAGAAELLIDYGRPSVRGRTVWGGTLVPFNAIWRTGANAATQLRTSRDLDIGGVAVPAGTYTLWTWAAPDGYQLVINKQTGQWGTDYSQAQDLGRVPLRATTLSQPVEQFTFRIDPSGSGGTIRMMWGDRELSVPFTVR